MAHIDVRDDVDVSLDDPVLVEGLPGVGLVGKIATDHLVEQLEMTYYAGIDCEGIPQVAVYDDSSRAVRPPVRLYVDESNALLALQSDVPVSRTAATEFADCITRWAQDVDVFPLYLSGLPVEEQPDVPETYAVATGDGASLADDYDLSLPPERGVVAGPTGSLLNRAASADLDSLGLIVESDPQFPDPAAARKLLADGVEPITGADVDTDELVERAEEIREQKEKLAQRMQQAAESESSQAQPMRMYQ